MPLVDWSDGAAFELYYSGSRAALPSDHPLFDPSDVGYGQRLNRDAIFGKRFRVLTTVFPIQPSDRILVVGCAFGYLIERFHDGGFSLCWGIDSSDDIATRGPTESRGDVLWVKDSFTGVGRVRNALRQLTGDDVFDWIITESVLESYDDGEIAAILNVCEGGLAGADLSHIIHIVTDVPEYPVPRSFWGPFNWKTLADWKAMRPAHSWTGPANGYEVL